MNNKYLEEVLNNFPNPIWVAGTDGKCYFFNKNWLEFTGRSMEEEQGDGWTEGVHADDYDQCVKEYIAAFDQKKNFKLEYRLKHADGTYHWILDYGAPHYSAEGEFLGYIGSCYDAQKSKEYVEEIKRQNEELEKMNKYMVDRELRIKGLKEELHRLKNNQ